MNALDMKNLKLPVFLVLLLVILFSCGIYRNRVDVNQGGAVLPEYQTTLPVEYLRNKMIVPVMIHGEQRRFIFDTGAITVISKSLFEEMNYPELGSGFFYDIHRNMDTTRVVSVKSLGLGGVEFQNIPALVYDLERLPWLCFKVDGIIGSNMLRNSAIQVDLKDRVIKLSHTRKGLMGQGTDEKMRLNGQNAPYIKMSFAGDKPRYYLFDSGSDGFINMNREYFRELKERVFLRQQRQGHGSGVMGMIGTGKDQTVYRFTLDSVVFGGHSMSDPVIEVSSTPSKVGSQLFHYGKVTMDYAGETFHFEPYHDRLKYRPSEGPGFGFIPVVKEDTFRVGLVWENSLVDSLGLKPGYRILRINDYD